MHHYASRFPVRDQAYIPHPFAVKWFGSPSDPLARWIYLQLRRMLELGSKSAPSPAAVAAAVATEGVGDQSGAGMHVLFGRDKQQRPHSLRSRLGLEVNKILPRRELGLDGPGRRRYHVANEPGYRWPMARKRQGASARKRVGTWAPLSCPSSSSLSHS